MFGYLYALQSKYKVIYETDDDNIFYDCSKLDNYLQTCSQHFQRYDTDDTVKQHMFQNVYLPFSQPNKTLWPRGFPHCNSQAIHNCQIKYVEDVKGHKTCDLSNVAVVQGLVNGDPDVDALLRLHKPEWFPYKFSNHFPTNAIYLTKYKGYCPFNSQNTFWIDRKLFVNMYLPITVQFRYTDILRSYVALHQFWKAEKSVLFTSPNAFQTRNVHNLVEDLKDELFMYTTVEKVVELLNKEENRKSDLLSLYMSLKHANIVEEREIVVLKEWLRLVDMYCVQ
jgi:hypothetical protein